MAPACDVPQLSEGLGIDLHLHTRHMQYGSRRTQCKRNPVARELLGSQQVVEDLVAVGHAEREVPLARGQGEARTRDVLGQPAAV